MSLSALIITFAVDGGGDYIPADHHLNHPPPTEALGLNIFAWVVDGGYEHSNWKQQRREKGIG